MNISVFWIVGPIYRVDFLENKVSNEKFLFYIFDFFFRVESPPFRLYHQLPTTLYIKYIYISWFNNWQIIADSNTIALRHTYQWLTHTKREFPRGGSRSNMPITAKGQGHKTFSFAHTARWLLWRCLVELVYVSTQSNQKVIDSKESFPPWLNPTLKVFFTLTNLFLMWTAIRIETLELFASMRTELHTSHTRQLKLA